MPKLRKMLGNVDAPETVALMRLIETQSRETLAAWACGYAESRMLPIAAKYGDEPRLGAACAAVRAYLAGEGSMKGVRAAVGEARKAAQEAENPILQAAARAVSTACAVIWSPTGALGFTFYAQAVIAYDEAGTDADRTAQDELAGQENVRILESLRAAAVVNEPNPVKVDWGC